MFERAALARILPFVTYLLFIFIADMLGRLGYAPQDLRWLYGVKIGCVVVLLWLFRREYGELAVARPSWPVLAGAVLTGIVILLLWLRLDAPWMVIGDSAGFDPRTDGSIDYLLAAVRIAGAALVVPLMEELFWRSYLMRWLTRPDFLEVDPRRVTCVAFVVTVILFGFEHNLWFAGVVAGAAYSLLYMCNRNIWSPILAHAVTNGLLGIWVLTTAHWSYW